MPMLANVGVPMIFIQWPLMLWALVPVIVLEALLIRRWLPLSLWDSFVGVGKVNLLSTLVGVPLTWLTMLALEIGVMTTVGMAAERWEWDFHGPVWSVLGFLISVAWLAPYEGGLHWMMPAAVAILFVPCFYLSVVLERHSCTRSWTAMNPVRIRQSVFAANLASYALLFLLACGWFAFELATQGWHVERHPDDAVRQLLQDDG